MKISTLTRDHDLECSIDLKYLMNLRSTPSISVFLNALDSFIEQFLERDDGYSRNQLFRLFRKKNNLKIKNTNILDLKEIAYIERIKKNINTLETEIFGEKTIFKNPVIDTINFITEKITQDSDNKNINGIVKEALPYLSNHRYAVSERSNNITIYIQPLKHKIHIVNNPELFSINDITNSSSIIINQQVSNIPLEISENSQIRLISYRPVTGKYFRLIDFYLPLEHCIALIYDLAYRKINTADYENDLNEKFTDLLNHLKALKDKNLYFTQFIDKTTINDIRSIRLKVRKIHLNYNDSNRYGQVINMISDILRIYLNNIELSINLDKNIITGISEIKRNNALYILSKNNKKNIDSAFGEENLSAILASTLRCLYAHNKGITVHNESTVGNGRSDIRINLRSSTIGLVESKLLRSNKNSNVNYEQETRNGIDQLFSRYSENEHLTENKNIELFLILFSYDSNFQNLASKVRNSIETYQKNNYLAYEFINNTENSIKFKLTESRESLGLLDKSRIINIIVCNLEIDYKTKSKERTKK